MMLNIIESSCVCAIPIYSADNSTNLAPVDRIGESWVFC